MIYEWECLEEIKGIIDDWDDKNDFTAAQALEAIWDVVRKWYYLRPYWSDDDII